jgi:hypothetical protein
MDCSSISFGASVDPIGGEGSAAAVRWKDTFGVESPREPEGDKLLPDGKFTMAMMVPDGHGNLIPMEKQAQRMLFDRIADAAMGVARTPPDVSSLRRLANAAAPWVMESPVTEDDLKKVSGFSIFKDKIRLYIDHGPKRPLEEKDIPFDSDTETPELAELWDGRTNELPDELKQPFRDTLKFFLGGGNQTDFQEFKRVEEDSSSMNLALDLRPRKKKLPSDLRTLLNLTVAAHGRYDLPIDASNHRKVAQFMDSKLGWGERAEARRQQEGSRD